MDIREKVQKLRQLMKEKNIQAYIIPSSDDHESEYVADYFKTRQFISGFTGSAGTVVVTLDEAGLWTDGRYFIQAENQLQGTGIKLFKQGEEGVPTIEKYLEDIMAEGSILGLDGKVMNAKQVLGFETKLQAKKITLYTEDDLVGEFWENRPAFPNSQAFLLETKYSGKSSTQKLEELRETMRAKDATVHVLTTLDDIAWLLNLRGFDVKHNPVVLAYVIVTLEEAYLFIQDYKLNLTLKDQLNKDHIIVKDYNEIYQFVKYIGKENKVLLDSSKVNYAIYHNLSKGIEKVDEMNPTVLAKSKKNLVELENIRKSHLKDGVAFTKFMYWLKTNIGKIEITEMSASEKLEDFRRQQEDFIEPSFHTIAAYKEHAAMMHYSANEESNALLNPEHLFLVDSGGQYYDGTTDITRTIALGALDDTLKLHFTSVVRGMINLSMAKFLQGVRGHNLDILARRPLWNLGLDYKCGTGHGVGFLLNVHEAPNGFRWKTVPERNDSCELEEGMVTTNEPGVYIEGSHGIRIENELVVRKAEKNEYGQFMDFEVVTFAPIDLDGINSKWMNEEEKHYLNEYHQKVYEKISPFLTSQEKEWLQRYTRSI